MDFLPNGISAEEYEKIEKSIQEHVHLIEWIKEQMHKTLNCKFVSY